MSNKTLPQGTALVKSGGKDKKVIADTEIDMDLLNKVSAAEQKVAQLKVTTSLTNKEIAKACKMSIRKLNKCLKDENVQLMMKHYQRTLLVNDIEITKQQNALLREKMYSELHSRFEEPDLEELEDMEGVTERKIYLQRYAKFANFKDFAKIFIDFNKIVVEDQNRGATKDDRNEIVKEVYSRAETRRMRRKKRQEVFDEAGVKDNFYAKVIDRNTDGSYKIADESYRPVHEDDFEEFEAEVVVEERHEIHFLQKGDNNEE